MFYLRLNQFIYVVGGCDGKKELNTAARYDTKNEKWHAIASMKEERNLLSVTVLNGLLYAIGGIKRTKYLDTIEFYDPSRDQWQELSVCNRLTTGRFGHMSAVICQPSYDEYQNQPVCLDSKRDSNVYTDTRNRKRRHSPSDDDKDSMNESGDLKPILLYPTFSDNDDVSDNDIGKHEPVLKKSKSLPDARDLENMRALSKHTNSKTSSSSGSDVNIDDQPSAVLNQPLYANSNKDCMNDQINRGKRSNDDDENKPGASNSGGPPARKGNQIK